MRFILFLLVGLAAGWISGQLMKGKSFGLAGNLFVGVAGAMFGGLIFGVLGIHASGILGQLLLASVGAMLFLGGLSMMKKQL